MKSSSLFFLLFVVLTLSSLPLFATAAKLPHPSSVKCSDEVPALRPCSNANARSPDDSDIGTGYNDGYLANPLPVIGTRTRQVWTTALGNQQGQWIALNMGSSISFNTLIFQHPVNPNANTLDRVSSLKVWASDDRGLYDNGLSAASSETLLMDYILSQPERQSNNLQSFRLDKAATAQFVLVNVGYNGGNPGAGTVTVWNDPVTDVQPASQVFKNDDGEPGAPIRDTMLPALVPIVGDNINTLFAASRGFVSPTSCQMMFGTQGTEFGVPASNCNNMIDALPDSVDDVPADNFAEGGKTSWGALLTQGGPHWIEFDLGSPQIFDSVAFQQRVVDGGPVLAVSSGFALYFKNTTFNIGGKPSDTDGAAFRKMLDGDERMPRLSEQYLVPPGNWVCAQFVLLQIPIGGTGPGFSTFVLMNKRVFTTTTTTTTTTETTTTTTETTTEAPTTMTTTRATLTNPGTRATTAAPTSSPQETTTAATPTASPGGAPPTTTSSPPPPPPSPDDPTVTRELTLTVPVAPVPPPRRNDTLPPVVTLPTITPPSTTTTTTPNASSSSANSAGGIITPTPAPPISVSASKQQTALNTGPAAAASTTTAQVLGALSGNPSSAVLLSRAESILKSAACGAELGPTGLPEDEIGIASSPLQLRLGSDNMTTVRGTVVGNSVFLLAFFVLHLVVAGILYISRRPRGSSSSSSDGDDHEDNKDEDEENQQQESFAQACIDTRFPGLVFVPLYVLISPTSPATSALIFFVPAMEILDYLCIILGVVVFLVFPFFTVLSFLVIIRRRKLSLAPTSKKQALKDAEEERQRQLQQQQNEEADGGGGAVLILPSEQQIVVPVKVGRRWASLDSDDEDENTSSSFDDEINNESSGGCFSRIFVFFFEGALDWESCEFVSKFGNIWETHCAVIFTLGELVVSMTVGVASGVVYGRTSRDRCIAASAVSVAVLVPFVITMVFARPHLCLFDKILAGTGSVSTLIVSCLVLAKLTQSASDGSLDEALQVTGRALLVLGAIGTLSLVDVFVAFQRALRRKKRDQEQKDDAKKRKKQAMMLNTKKSSGSSKNNKQQKFALDARDAALLLGGGVEDEEQQQPAKRKQVKSTKSSKRPKLNDHQVPPPQPEEEMLDVDLLQHHDDHQVSASSSRSSTLPHQHAPNDRKSSGRRKQQKTSSSVNLRELSSSDFGAAAADSPSSQQQQPHRFKQHDDDKHHSPRHRSDHHHHGSPTTKKTSQSDEEEGVDDLLMLRRDHHHQHPSTRRRNINNSDVAPPSASSPRRSDHRDRDSSSRPSRDEHSSSRRRPAHQHDEAAAATTDDRRRSHHSSRAESSSSPRHQQQQQQQFSPREGGNNSNRPPHRRPPPPPSSSRHAAAAAAVHDDDDAYFEQWKRDERDRRGRDIQPSSRRRDQVDGAGGSSSPRHHHRSGDDTPSRSRSRAGGGGGDGGSRRPTAAGGASSSSSPRAESSSAKRPSRKRADSEVQRKRLELL